MKGALTSSVGPRFLVGAAAVGLSLLLGALPAKAATRSIEWINPTLADPVLREAAKISVMTHNDDGRSTDRIEISIENPPPSGDPCTPTPLVASVRPPSGTRGDVPFEADIAFPCNGSYSMVAKAWNTRQGLDPANMWSSPLSLRVAIPPATVAGLSSSGWIPPAEGDGTGSIELSWQANAEADLIGYRIERSVNDQSLVTLAEVGAGAPTTYVDADLPVAGAEYTYTLMAMRRAPTAEGRVESATPTAVVVTAGKPVADPIVGAPVTAPPTTPTTTTPTTTPTTAPPNTRTISPTASSGESADKSVSTSAGPTVARETTDESGGLEMTIELDPQNSDDSSSTTPTTIDTGYEDRLPFAEGTEADTGTDTSEGLGYSTEELGAGEETARRRAMLVPVASALILVVGWMFVRLIRRELARAEVADTPELGNRPQWSMVPTSRDDTTPVPIGGELHPTRRVENPTEAQRV